MAKQHSIRGWYLVPLWAAVAAAIWLLTNISPSLNGWLRDQQHLAGWAQAIGVVITVIAGIWSIKHQIAAAYSLEDEKRQRALLARTEIVYQLLGNVLDAIDAAHAALEVNLLKDISGRVDALERGATSLENLPSFEMPGPGIAILVIQVPPKLRRLARHVKSLHAALMELNPAQTMYPSSAPTIPVHPLKRYREVQFEARETCAEAMRGCERQRDSIRSLLT